MALLTIQWKAKARAFPRDDSNKEELLYIILQIKPLNYISNTYLLYSTVHPYLSKYFPKKLSIIISVLQMEKMRQSDLLLI